MVQVNVLVDNRLDVPTAVVDSGETTAGSGEWTVFSSGKRRVPTYL